MSIREESAALHEVSRQPFTPNADKAFVMGSIATTEVCNLSCVFCHFNGPNAPKKAQELSPELVRKALHDLAPGTQVYFAATGEFFLDPHALEHLQAALELKLTPLVLSHGQAFTGPLLDDLLAKGVRHFRMSCDAIDPVSYARIRRGGELQPILDAALHLRTAKSLYPDITVEINCTLLSNSAGHQEEFIEFWRGKVDAVNFNAEYFDTFRFRNIHWLPTERVDCEIQTYVLPSGKIAPCCAMMVYAHDNDVSWLPDIRTHTLQQAHDELTTMYNEPGSQLGTLCAQCDWWIMWARRDGVSPYLRCVPLTDRAPDEPAPLIKTTPLSRVVTWLKELTV